MGFGWTISDGGCSEHASLGDETKPVLTQCLLEGPSSEKKLMESCISVLLSWVDG